MLSIRGSLALFVLSLFATVAVVQGQKRDAAPFEDEISAFEAMDRTNPPPTNAVLFVGSSSVRFWTNLAQSFPQLTIIRRGFGGSHIPDCTAFADRIIIPYRPSKIVLYAGDNDIARGDSPEEVFSAFQKFIAKVQGTLPATKIYFIAIKPAPIRWHLSPQQQKANELIRRYCAHHRNLRFIDVWPATLAANGQPDARLYKSDGLHMNERGYARWVPIITKALKD